jgi:galactose mutarotase-like enzyme
MIIQNDKICATIDLHGAELTSLKKQGSEEELIWTADKDYWGRHAPMLFPIVGKVWNSEYRVGDKIYRLSQHGFARDLNFTALCQDSDSVVLALESNDDTLKVYPYKFRIEATYRLEENTLVVEWRIKNPGSETMYFQIGAHPGFNYRDFDKNDFIHGYFRLIQAEEPVSRLIIGQLTPEGYRSDNAGMIELDSDAMLPITPGLFAADALVLEEHQIDQVILYDKDCTPYIALETEDAPVWGLWSPPGKNAPFVCIEPWMGRCDCHGYEGSIEGRDYINKLEPGKSTAFTYRITAV